MGVCELILYYLDIWLIRILIVVQNKWFDVFFSICARRIFAFSLMRAKMSLGFWTQISSPHKICLKRKTLKRLNLCVVFAQHFPLRTEPNKPQSIIVLIRTTSPTN